MRIVVGDVHGCLDEFSELLKKVGYKKGRDELLLAGDVLDRGPYPNGAVAEAMNQGALFVKGNHEEKALRFIRHELERAKNPSYKNPIQNISEDRQAQWRSLTIGQVKWLQDAPLWIEWKYPKIDWLVVHAGFEPGLSLDKQKSNCVIRIRYVNKNGTMVGYKENSLAQPEDTEYWTRQWKGPQNVIYGHAVHSLRDPKIEVIDVMGTGGHHSHSAHCIGIDTGCCFGGRLTALTLDDQGRYDIVQVEAKKVYYPWPGGDGTTSGDK